MTLKEFIEENNLNLNQKDMARIGYMLKFLKDRKYTYKQENNYLVRDYKKNFFKREDVHSLIIKYMTNGRG